MPEYVCVRVSVGVCVHEVLLLWVMALELSPHESVKAVQEVGSPKSTVIMRGLLALGVTPGGAYEYGAAVAVTMVLATCTPAVFLSEAVNCPTELYE